MSTALNDRDAILQAASVRIINPKNASILLNASSSLFHTNAAGDVDVPTITIAATLIGLEGDVIFTADGAALTSVTGKSAVVRYADMQGPAAIVTARIAAGGQTFSQSCIIFVVRDGAPGNGTPGARGAGQHYAFGDAWSDGLADAATPGGNVVNDVVTISNGGRWAMTKRWDGATWQAMGGIFDGSLFVTGSIDGAAIRAGTLDIRAPDGTIILKATSSLAEQTKVSPNIAARVSSWTSRFGGAGVVTGSGDGRFINGEYVYMPTGAEYTGVNSNPLGIKPNQYYTVSFDAYCDGAPRVLSADIYGSGLDTPGIGIQLTNTLTRYKFTEQMPDFASSPNAYLRMFAGNSGSIIIISNVKVELGATETAWSDNVITPGNAASYIMPGAVNNTMIGGDLYSTNWNGIVGPGGAGWLMQRSGVLYAAAVVLRGSICGGAYKSYAWPAPGLGGFYNGPEGALYGNANGDGGYVQISADGAIRTPNFSSIGNNVKVTGEISGSVIRTSVLALESARLLTPWNRLAPFSLFDSGSVYNPRVANATVTLDGFVGPAQGGENTFHAKRFGSFKKDVFLKATMHGDETWENLYIEARYHDASQGWGNLASGSVFCEGRAGISVVIRYTPHDGGWDYIAFRARTTQGKCLSLVFEMQTFNFNESVNAPGSSSGMPTGDSGGGGVGNNPEPWCVDYETTRLPDGRFARDVTINDLMECWDFNLENPGVEYAPANKVAFGEEASTMLVTKTGVQIIQSNSTPMTVRDGRVVLTPGMLGEEVVVKRGNDLVWEPITQTFDMGVRRVVKISLHDRMYFAGMDPKATIATHNLEYKP
jgi:hypothetical protein